MRSKVSRKVDRGLNDPGAGKGMGVDRQGGPVVDPTKNVLDLVESAMRRQDDLRNLVAHHATEMRKLVASHTDEVARLRAHYDEELRKAETARIDAIRAVDVGAVNRAAEVSAQQATTLAAQVATSAETLRTQVAAAATAATVALAAALQPIQKDIADLRQAQYQAQGEKTQVVETRDVQTSTRGGNQLVIAVIGSIVGLIGLLLLIYTISKGSK
jgi:hypothetical protein